MSALTVIPQQPIFSMGDIERVAEAIAKGGLFGSRDPYAVLTLCLLAQAEGQHPAVVFRDYHIISGKPAKKADAMLRDFIVGGGKVEWHTLDDECADATFSHPSGGTVRIAWDKARVAQAQLGGNAMHKKYPRQMLRARVISEGVRTVYPGATSGLYVPEEAAAFDSPVHDLTPEPETHSGPAPRTKLEGPHTSKTALRSAISTIDTAIRGAQTLDALNVILKIKGNKATIAQAERDWPELIHGDPEIAEAEGLQKLVARRREELAEPDQDGQFALLIKSMEENQTTKSLASWVATNELLIDELSDVERRSFELALSLHESNITQMDTVRA